MIIMNQTHTTMNILKRTASLTLHHALAFCARRPTYLFEQRIPFWASRKGRPFNFKVISYVRGYQKLIFNKRLLNTANRWYSIFLSSRCIVLRGKQEAARTLQSPNYTSENTWANSLLITQACQTPRMHIHDQRWFLTRCGINFQCNFASIHHS